LVSKALFSSDSTEWETPPELYGQLNKEFWFDMDVCATILNSKCYHCFLKEHDGLKQDWASRAKTCWCNPPYGKTIGDWIRKAWEESRKGCTVVCLLPARTDTKYFHGYIWDKHSHRPKPGVEVRFLQGRLRFVGAKSSAPFPSMIVIFRPDGR